MSCKTMTMFQMIQLQQQQSLIIILPLNVFQINLLYSLQSCTLCTYLALDRVETADDDERNFIIFYDSKSALQAISGQDWTHPLVLYILECLNWLVQYQKKRILFYWIPSHVGFRGNEKADAAAKAGLLRRVTNVPILYGDFKKHINVLLKHKWQSQGHPSLLDSSATGASLPATQLSHRGLPRC